MGTINERLQVLQSVQQEMRHPFVQISSFQKLDDIGFDVGSKINLQKNNEMFGM